MIQTKCSIILNILHLLLHNESIMQKQIEKYVARLFHVDTFVSSKQCHVSIKREHLQVSTDQATAHSLMLFVFFVFFLWPQHMTLLFYG